MKKHLLTIVFSILALGGAMPAWAQSPSTEGTDFWVTFLRTDANTPDSLQLIFSAQETCQVTVSNPYKTWTETFTVAGGTTVKHDYKKSHQADCYTQNNEIVSQTALHVTSTKNISLFAANYRVKSLDATNVLPTSALKDEYYIQTYPASNHSGASSCDGTHFCIIAAEDNTIVDYTLTAATKNGHAAGTTRQTTTLKKGQVWYVWTGQGKAGDQVDFSGTHVVARDGKSIAVFEGAPHTNLPYEIADRDHMFSQAMPTDYWGTQFAITSSLTTIDNQKDPTDADYRKLDGLWERYDKIRVMALNPGTKVYIDGKLVYTFPTSFSASDKRTYEFDFGKTDEWSKTDFTTLPTGTPFFEGNNHIITTSCPAAVHQFFTSNDYDHDDSRKIVDPTTGKQITYKSCNGDPAEMWVSPVEQVIKKITFATYNTVPDHFVNIVTTDPSSMTMNGGSIASDFQPMDADENYYYARISIPAGAYTLAGKTGFTAFAYGFGQRESYAYSCGSSTVSQSIIFNGEHVGIDSIYENAFCVGEPIEMTLQVGSNSYQSVLWDFGDGISEQVQGSGNTTHTYTNKGWMDLCAQASYVNTCSGEEFTEPFSVHFYVNIPDTVGRKDSVCYGEPWPYDGKIYYRDTTIMYDDGACDTIYRYSLHVGKPSPINEYSETAVDSFRYDGEWYYTSQDIEKHYLNMDKCDSTVLIHLTVHTALDITINSGIYDCVNDKVNFEYTINKGDYDQIENLGLIHQGDTLKPDEETSGSFSFYAEPFRPGTYQDVVYIYDNLTHRKLNLPVELEIYFPSSVFVYKYNNVLAVLRTNWNGGYQFRTYQWYRNDTILPGATSSIYHTTTPFTNASYYVYLTGKDTLTNKTVSARSCAQEVEARGYTPSEPDPNPAATTKRLIREHLYIFRSEDEVYDAFGRRVR